LYSISWCPIVVSPGEFPVAKVPTKTKPPVVDDGWRIPDPLWTRIVELLPPRPVHPLGCHNPRVDDRRAMDAIFFVLRTGCQWNALNATGICTSSSAHRRFQEWVAAGVFARLWVVGVAEYDVWKGIDGAWLAMDGAMTKAPLGGESTGQNPTDRGKRGVKRSLLVEGNGVPIGVAIDGANRHDKKLVEATIDSLAAERPDPTPEDPQGMCLDKGYDYDNTRELIEEFGFTAHVRARGEEAQAIKREAGFRARRWVVERTHSGLNRFRRILVRWEKNPLNYLALLHFACAMITYRSCDLLR
jgi:putative transposase